MENSLLKLRQLILIGIGLFFFLLSGKAQYKNYSLSANGDTINIIDKNGLKQGRWVTTVGEIRGEPGYDEEGLYKDNEKTGPWRKYTSTGDILAIENFRLGGKDGRQEYFNFLGILQRQEEWKGYNPDFLFDTIAVYGNESNEILSYKIVKALPYSVKNGEWKYFDSEGRILKIEKYDRGALVIAPDKNTAVKENPKVETPEKEKVKTKEILDYEKKYSKKKRQQLERDGKTGL
ncbi:MAG: hypothetical protein EBZ95_04300 [Chitinophagia bacterium]|nr:hypothetical protein [Chitinophagia bacterium]